MHLREIAWVFLRLGFTAFGGPAAHVALMEEEVVRRRGWLDRQHFLDLVSAINFIPGPNSTELAIHLGLIRGGYAGLVVAGICFIVPAVLIILPLAWLYVHYNTLPAAQYVLAGVSAAIVAVVVAALVRFAQTSLTGSFAWGVAVAAGLAAWWVPARSGLPTEVMILTAAAVAGVARERLAGQPLAAVAPLPLLAAEVGAQSVGGMSGWPAMAAMAWFFLKVGATLFGSGYVLVSYLQNGLVTQLGWLTEQELLDAVAVGQVTPGPLLTTATFVGYLLGQKLLGSTAGAALGGVLATVAIFLPSFVFVALLGGTLDRVRNHRLARSALDGMNAAVVALIAVVAWRIAAVAITDAVAVLICAGTVGGLLVWRVNATWLVVLAAVAGWARGAIS